MLYTNYAGNKIVDHIFRGVGWTVPTALGIGLLTTTKGPRANSTVYALNDTISLTANDGITHLYKCTTAGTTAAAQSTLYPGVKNEAITDGSAVFTEQYNQIKAGLGGAMVEASYTNYARATTGVVGNTTNWAATNGPTTTTNPSSGTGVPTTSNNNIVTIGAAAGSGPAYVWAVGIWDAGTVGNLLTVDPLTTVKTVNNADPAPTIAVSALSISLDS